MTSIFIPSLFGDTDSLMVKVALEQRGHRVFRWVGDNFPQKQTASFYISNGEKKPGDRLRTHFPSCDYGDIDVVWLRRPRWPVLPENLHRGDKVIAEQECRQFIQSFFQSSWGNACWVNSLGGRRKANSKMLQLEIAKKTGMLIPETLISNDADDIRHFIKTYHHGVIVKALLGGDWSENDKRYVTYTSAISEADLPSAAAIRNCPCILQRKVEKKYEVRLVFFGAHALAVQLDSQQTHDGKLDWRITNPSALRIKQLSLPDAIYVKCRELMKALGIVHGSFDFAVTPAGEWVFFEVNEAGQFLWIEHYAPDVPMLEAATQFLADPSNEFVMSRRNDRAAVSAIMKNEKYRAYVKDDNENIVSLNLTAML